MAALQGLPGGRLGLLGSGLARAGAQPAQQPCLLWLRRRGRLLLTLTRRLCKWGRRSCRVYLHCEIGVISAAGLLAASEGNVQPREISLLPWQGWWLERNFRPHHERT